MRIAYFDCFSGISGDMTIAAFLDAGLSFAALTKQIAKLKLKGYELKKSKTFRGAIVGTKFDCIARDDSSDSHRSLKEILVIIDKSSLAEKVKKTAKGIFIRIGEAEAKVHGIGRNRDIRLHELGGIDSIIDIVGTAIAIDELGIDEVYASAINLGRATVNTRHGLLPVPAPATLELLKGAPTKISDVESELVTPTGAGILRALSKGFGPSPQMEIAKIGYGAGSRDLPGWPNMLRIMIGEKAHAFREDGIMVIETNIDDMSPQSFEYLFERLLGAGALDVYTTHIQMKKSRPAFKLTALAEPGDLKRISRAIFKETTAIGVRFYEAARFKLERKFVRVKTTYGEIKVKLSGGASGILTASPEYEECVKIARKKNIPLKVIFEEAKNAIKAR